MMRDCNPWRPHRALRNYRTAIVGAAFGLTCSFGVLAAVPSPTAAQGIAAIEYRLVPPAGGSRRHPERGMGLSHAVFG